jgi:hypothetical protein
MRAALNQLIEQVMRWPAQDLEVTALDSSQLQPAGWDHFATSCYPQFPAHDFRVGATVWVLRQPDAKAAIAWEWAEVREGVVALSDPNSLVSNIQIVGAPMGLERVDPIGRKRLILNTIVHSLPWQLAVLRVLKAPGRACVKTPSHRA